MMDVEVLSECEDRVEMRSAKAVGPVLRRSDIPRFGQFAEANAEGDIVRMELTFDLSAVESIEPSAVVALLQLTDELAGTGGGIVLHSIRPGIERSFEVDQSRFDFAADEIAANRLALTRDGRVLPTITAEDFQQARTSGLTPEDLIREFETGSGRIR